MKLNEQLRELRISKGLTQENVGEVVGVSRQAVTKWEKGISTPSSNNLLALAVVYDISIDVLANNKCTIIKKEHKILQSNKILIAILFQAVTINVAVQPLSTDESGNAYIFLLMYKLIPLIFFSGLMSLNLSYEKNKIQYNKNVKIELLYCVTQALISIITYYLKLGILGTIAIVINCLIYILIVNPKYMNRQLAHSKNK